MYISLISTYYCSNIISLNFSIERRISIVVGSFFILDDNRVIKV